MSWQVKSVFLQWLPWFLRMSRPGKKITRKTINMNSKMNELQLKEKACKSLLANVLDMDDDLRLVLQQWYWQRNRKNWSTLKVSNNVTYNIYLKDAVSKTAWLFSFTGSPPWHSPWSQHSCKALLFLKIIELQLFFHHKTCNLVGHVTKFLKCWLSN